MTTLVAMVLEEQTLHHERTLVVPEQDIRVRTPFMWHKYDARRPGDDSSLGPEESKVLVSVQPLAKITAIDMADPNHP